MGVGEWPSNPAGKLIMHSCDNPPCVNPAHLSTGTYSEARGTRRQGRNPGSTTARGGRPRTLDVSQIRNMRSVGMTYIQIAAALGSSGSTVWRTLNADPPTS